MPVIIPDDLIVAWGPPMGTCWVPLPCHVAKIDEVLEVRWSDYYGAMLFGDDGEIAVLPHKRCRLEVVRTAPSSHRDVNLVLPGQVCRYRRSFFFLDRFELPTGATVGLWDLVGFTLRLVSDPIAPVPSEGRLHLWGRIRAVSRWRIWGSFDSARDCDASRTKRAETIARAQSLARANDPIDVELRNVNAGLFQAMAYWQCIASDDPRLVP